LIFFSSEIEDGDAHRHTNMPILLAGRGGWQLSYTLSRAYGNYDGLYDPYVWH
jgi:hypothetical protein